MPKLTPVSQKKFIAKLTRLGFAGPFQEGPHPYMIRSYVVLTVPNPHDGDISVDLLVRLLRQAGISRQEWLGEK
ncbi:MAG: type II toxin-antitoxin system HicA family toxin [Candidatus Vogelbacteria bacterium]|nr:type II toxin-antitoxin system HicA family toxin [Candidatus Vogelbacteria bacterium]